MTNCSDASLRTEIWRGRSRKLVHRRVAQSRPLAPYAMTPKCGPIRRRGQQPDVERSQFSTGELLVGHDFA